MKNATNCDACANYSYDEDYECYFCEMDLDEDEMERFLRGSCDSCSYFILNDEYKIVRKQL